MLDELLSLRASPYWAHAPTIPQEVFLLHDCREALFGGAAGGGKSDALLMAALQYVDVPGYAAILFRKTYADLSRPGALMDRAREWLSKTDAVWNETKKRWTFPSGATVSFGYCETPADVYAYQGAEFSFIGFDELTQFGEKEYTYLFSRLRRLQGCDVPLRVRAASNPGGQGHTWVRARFLIEGPASGRVFVPAKLEDNPHLDRVEYERSLSELDPITRAQLLEGDWGARDKDNSLVPEWTDETAKECTRDVPRPLYFTPYVVGDLGSRDLTVWLFAWWDFEKALLVIEDEVVLKNPSTSQMIYSVRQKERALWPHLPEQPRRFCDVDLRLQQDFREAGLYLRATGKKDQESHMGRARTLIGRRQVIINPRCRVLLLTLESAVWNANRTDYARAEGTGHADAWDAFIYLVRNVDRAHNPEPENQASWADQFGKKRLAQVYKPEPTQAAKAVSWALKGTGDRKREAEKIWVPGRKRR